MKFESEILITGTRLAGPRDSRRSLLPAPYLPTPRNQSLHFANRNRPNSLKTSAEKKFNRYTFRALQSRHWLCALCDPEASGWPIQICQRD
jgi:hypothetical protein